MKIFGFLSLLLIFMAGILNLFMLRFERGDVWPAYSSLRSDPLGTRAFYESLRQIQGLSVTRNFRPLSKITDGKDTTLFYAGVPVSENDTAPKELIDAFERIAFSGGRVVITFLPVTSHSPITSNAPDEPEQDENKSKNPEKKKEKTAAVIKNESVSLKEHWGIWPDYDKGLKKGEQAQLLEQAGEITLPESLSWHSLLWFHTNEKWKVIYARKGKTVMAERSFGAGSAVIASDSFFLSNEALGSERHHVFLAGLLAWLTGNSRNILFDEAHLGIQDQPGVAGLARKYRLHGFFWGLMVLSGLFVWKNISHFVPHAGEEAQAKDILSSRDYTDGLISLLRRNIPSGEILPLCYAEWKKTVAAEKNVSPEKIRQIHTIVETRSIDPHVRSTVAEIWRRICGILSSDR